MSATTHRWVYKFNSPPRFTVAKIPKTYLWIFGIRNSSLFTHSVVYFIVTEIVSENVKVCQKDTYCC